MRVRASGGVCGARGGILGALGGVNGTRGSSQISPSTTKSLYTLSPSSSLIRSLYRLFTLFSLEFICGARVGVRGGVCGARGGVRNTRPSLSLMLRDLNMNGTPVQVHDTRG